jgi:hypothetical protein
MTGLLTGLGLLAFAVLSVGAISSGWPGSLGGLPRRAGANSVLLAKQPHEIAFICSRIRAKDAVATKVAAGEMGLLEAAAWFRHLNETPADTPDRHWRREPGRCDGERLCRQVIRYVTNLQKEVISTEERDRLVLQLEEELAGHLAGHGTFALSGCELAAR